MTEEQNKLAELVALSEKATQGEWRNLRHYSKIAAKQMFPAKRLHASYARLIPVGKMVSRARDGKGKANGDFVVALVNWFRANHAALRSEREPATEAVLEELRSLVERALELHQHAKFDNGVHDQSGRSEADYWATEWNDDAQRALKGKGASRGDAWFKPNDQGIAAPLAVTRDESAGSLETVPSTPAMPAVAAPEASGEFVRVPREEVIEIDEDGKVHPAKCEYCGRDLPLPLSAPDEQKG